MDKMSDLMHSEVKVLSYELEKMSNIDVLTNLYNRRFFNEMYQKEWYSALRSKASLAIIMIDIDYFKKYNDTYGHLQGDKCLKAVAEAIQESVKRPRDIVVRYGGEEFVILLPESSIDGAIHIAKTVLSNVEALILSHVASPLYGKVSVSIGVAALIPTNDNIPDLLLHTMDEALYRAKGDGRNCIRE
jgi:diguanylate cyclase (GGDEF)-like protein